LFADPVLTSQGERLASIAAGAVLVAFVVTKVVSCAKTEDYVQALQACNVQPSITVERWVGEGEKDSKKWKNGSEEFSALDRDRALIEAVSKCRQDVLAFAAKTHEKTDQGFIERNIP
jgi:hypothetical protein